MRVAVAGKGGAGKSLLAATLARVLARRGHRVLAIDSDPMPGLAVSLGMGALTVAALEDAVEADERGRWRLKRGIGAARAVQRFSIEGPDGVRVLQFGKAGRDGLAPVMGSLNGLYQVVQRLAREPVLSDWTIVGDLPAGPRQVAFRWAPYAEYLLVVVEPTRQSILTARRIMRIGGSSDAAVAPVANKVRDGDAAMIETHLRAEPLGALPFDPALAECERLGIAPIDHVPDSAYVHAVQELVERLGRRTVSAT